MHRSSKRYWPLLLLAAVTTEARADFFTHSWQNHREAEDTLTLGAEFNYYYSTANYDTNGNTFIPTGFESYGSMQTDFSAVYGMTDRLSLYGRLNWRRVNSKSTQLAADSSYGLGDQTVALNYRIYKRRTNSTSIDLQAQVDFPAYSNSDSATKNAPFIGDGSMDYTIGGFLTVPITERSNDELHLVGGGGYTYRNQGFSAAVPWSATLDYVRKNSGFDGSVSLFGIQSLKTDANSKNLALVNNPAGSLGSGGSFMTNAIDPTVFNIGGKIAYQSDSNWEIYASGFQALAGKSAPKGFQVALGAQVHLAPKEKKLGPPGKLTPVEYGRANKGHVDYNLNAKVVRANDRFNLIKIDKGRDDGVTVGEIFDIFITNDDGTSGPAIARGHVTDVRDAESALKIDEYFKEVWIEEGFGARRTTP